MLNLQGRILNEKYEIRGDKLLGKGGYGEVWLAWDNSLKRFVAVKILITQETPSPQQVDDFLREAQTIANLRHKHILEVYDLGKETFNGHLLPYLVMAFANKGTLAERIKSTPLSLQKTKDILKQVSEALDYIHYRRLFHLDLKPQNILFDAEDNAMVTDFGIAKVSSGEDEFTSLTNIRGTHGYMSPEQKTGKANSASDIYALGMVLRQMLAGGNSPIANDLPPETSPKIKEIINKATSVHPNSRYQSANELFTAFSKAIEESNGEPTEYLNANIVDKLNIIPNKISPEITSDITVKSQAEKNTPQGIPSPIAQRLVNTLLRCGPFSDNRTLQAYFVHQPISAWKNSLPLNNIGNDKDRVQITVAYLWTQYNYKFENALVLFLQVLSHDKDTNDKCQHDLADLAIELEDLAKKPRKPVSKINRLDEVIISKSNQFYQKTIAPHINFYKNAVLIGIGVIFLFYLLFIFGTWLRVLTTSSPTPIVKETDIAADEFPPTNTGVPIATPTNTPMPIPTNTKTPLPTITSTPTPIVISIPIITNTPTPVVIDHVVVLVNQTPVTFMSSFTIIKDSKITLTIQLPDKQRTPIANEWFNCQWFHDGEDLKNSLCNEKVIYQVPNQKQLLTLEITGNTSHTMGVKSFGFYLVPQ